MDPRAWQKRGRFRCRPSAQRPGDEGGEQCGGAWPLRPLRCRGTGWCAPGHAAAQAAGSSVRGRWGSRRSPRGARAPPPPLGTEHEESQVPATTVLFRALVASLASDTASRLSPAVPGQEPGDVRCPRRGRGLSVGARTGRGPGGVGDRRPRTRRFPTGFPVTRESHDTGFYLVFHFSVTADIPHCIDNSRCKLWRSDVDAPCDVAAAISLTVRASDDGTALVSVTAAPYLVLPPRPQPLSPSPVWKPSERSLHL